MREREDHGERSHQRVWELLPWYVNGTLAQPERERVESHLASCRRCEEEVRTCRRTAAEIAGAGERGAAGSTGHHRPVSPETGSTNATTRGSERRRASTTRTGSPAAGTSTV